MILFFMEKDGFMVFLPGDKSCHGNHNDIEFKPFGCMQCHDLDQILVTFQSELTVFIRCGYGCDFLTREPFQQSTHTRCDS